MRRRSKIFVPRPSSLLSHLVVGLLSFYCGLHIGSTTRSSTADISNTHANLESLSPPVSITSNDQYSWPETVQSLFVGAARVPRDDFMQAFDIGVPLDKSTAHNNEVLLLYGPGSLPNDDTMSSSNVDGSSASKIPQIESTAQATQHCNVVKQVLLQPDQSGGCLALVGQWESYHVHKWIRDEDLFENVARSHKANDDKQTFPRHGQVVLMAKQYGQYMDLLDELYAEVKPIAAEVAGRGVHTNTVIVMVCNKGQSILLTNFVCAAKSRGIDTSKILLFASDLHTHQLADSLGLTSYFHERLFADMPEAAAKAYGDEKFKAMMMAKIYVVHIINLLGHIVLFSDVDMIWFKDPLPYFQTKAASSDFDVYFQDDGQHSAKYAPYSPNTGFYYMRQNKRTQFLLSHLLRMGDVVMNTGSHQAAMTEVMAEHSSWRGLKVKVISRDEPDFPCGYHFHHRRKFMEDMLAGKVEPYIFHMSWTEGKDDKIKYWQQLEEWYVSDEEPSSCGDDPKAAADCCLQQPIFRCHFKGKPSKKPCFSNAAEARGPSRDTKRQ